jgi:hypothetical protein
MSNPLLIFWGQLFGSREPTSRAASRVHIESSSQASSAIFLVMRRMRAPLITLIVIFSVSVVGLTLVPGIGPDGQPARIGLFEAFYFMSYTATTIGFGELRPRSGSVSCRGRSPQRSGSGSPFRSTSRSSAGLTRSALC